MQPQIGVDTVRKEAWQKVTGAAKYTADYIEPNILHAKLLTSTYASAMILNIDYAQALTMPGVKAILTGNDVPFLTGPILEDMPPLAKDKVRYFGEPVALVVADTEQNAKAAIQKIEVLYSPLPVINTISQAIHPNAPLIHERLGEYVKSTDDVKPLENTNINNHVKISKGDMGKGWANSDITVEGTFVMPQSDHAAMETRVSQCSIPPDGHVKITTSSQAPFSVKDLLASYTDQSPGNINVRVPFVGGGFGGKVTTQLDVLAFLASKAVGGKEVRLANTREEDLFTSPCHLGLEAHLRIGAKKDGTIFRIKQSNHLVRAKGIGCFMKTSDSPTDAISGVLLHFNKDGSININFGAVEIGPGMKTTACQILAQKMRMDVNRIFVKMEVDTETTPRHWKTVASMTTFMAGKAILQAADDLISQLLSLAGTAMRCSPDDLDYGDERVYLKSDPTMYLSFRDLVFGYKYPNGNAIQGQLLGRGSFIMGHLTTLDPETGKGKAGPGWTVGAQAVEVEYDTKQHTFRVLKAATVVDAGKVLNPKTAKGLLMGGMCMGLGLGICEEFLYNEQGIAQNTSFRTYKMMRYGETPDYLIDFVETPQIDAPFGARGFAEHGILGIPAALANALSTAAQTDIDVTPITPEYLWRKKAGLML